MKYRILLAAFFIAVGAQAQTTANVIRINQLGYYPGAVKIAIVTGPVMASRFYVVAASGSDTIFSAATGNSLQSSNSSLQTHVLDFSACHTKGRYRIFIPGLPLSYPFTIGANANQAVAVASLKGYYYLRASMPLLETFAGKWARPAGHPDTAVLIHPSAASAERPAGAIIATPGGWYDAGDYNKYIVNAGISTGTLLAAYEDFPGYFNTLHTNIPESNDAVPDVLNEALYNLRWMFSMQDPFDGGVYNKCTNAAFDGMVMPGVTKLPRYVVQKGTAATLDFAAVMAQCSRIAKKFSSQLPGLSDSCMQAAQKAWQWSLAHPAMAYDQNAINQLYEPKISTGGYGDHEFADEWFWAASELFATSKEKPYENVVMEKLNDSMMLPSWGNVRMLGFYSLIRNQQSLPSVMQKPIAQVKARLLQFADTYLAHVKQNAFQTVMGQSKKDFNWGSNANAANQGILLINAYRVSKKLQYINGALSNLDYILGRNATGYCFVTGIGSRSTLHPHHRPSVADGIEAPVPGLLAGGPNPGMQDKCHYDFTEPETAYSDVDCAYASNEIAINWNAPLVYLSNALEALQYEIGYSKEVVVRRFTHSLPGTGTR